MSNLSGFVKRIRDIMRNDAGINGDAQRIEQMAWMLFLKVYDAKEQDWDMNEDYYESIIPEECRWCNWAVDDKSGKATVTTTVDVYVLAETYTESVEIAEEVIKSLNRVYANYDKFSVIGASLTGANEDYVSQTYVQQLTFNFLIQQQYGN